MEKFDEAITCSKRQLSLARELESIPIEIKALYNLGNVWHAKGRIVMNEYAGVSCLISTSSFKINDDLYFKQELDNSFEKATHYYEENLLLSRQIDDKASEGRALGQLGNVNYRVGNWRKAIDYHTARLKIAQKLKDLSGERRALANLANAYAGDGRLDLAIDFYTRALQIARRTKEYEAEAQACWSLAAAHDLLDNHSLALDFQKRHLSLAEKLGDKFGQAKSSLNLAPMYQKLGQTSLSKQCAARAKELAFSLNDESMFENAVNVYKQVCESNSQETDLTTFLPDALNKAEHQSTKIYEKTKNNDKLNIPESIISGCASDDEFTDKSSSASHLVV